MQPNHSLSIIEHDTHAVVYPQGYLNGPAGEMIDSTCAELIKKGQKRIIINFQQTETMNTMGIANLISVLERVAKRSGVLCFSNLIKTNQQILDVLDISRAVLIFNEEAEALHYITERFLNPQKNQTGPAAATP